MSWFMLLAVVNVVSHPCILHELMVIPWIWHPCTSHHCGDESGASFDDSGFQIRDRNCNKMSYLRLKDTGTFYEIVYWWSGIIVRKSTTPAMLLYSINGEVDIFGWLFTTVTARLS
jgi:hypothetical protein